MRFKYTTVEQASQWHRKFLWLPQTIDGEYVVFETVWRRLVRVCPPDGFPVYEYSTNITTPGTGWQEP